MAKLERALVAMESRSLSNKEFDTVHATFHDTIAIIAGNSYVIRYLQDLEVFRTRMVSLEWISKTRVYASFPEHRTIVQAIREGQPDQAEELARLHVVKTRESLINRLTRGSSVQHG